MPKATYKTTGIEVEGFRRRSLIGMPTKEVNQQQGSNTAENQNANDARSPSMNKRFQDADAPFKDGFT